MRGEYNFFPWYVRDGIVRTLTPAFGAFADAPEFPSPAPRPGPEEPQEGLYPLTFWSDGRPISSIWLPPGTAARVRKSRFLADPVELVLIAVLPRRYPGWVRVDVSAVAGSEWQLKALLDLVWSGRDRAPLREAAWGRPALVLGHRWGAIPDLALPFDAEDPESKVAAARQCDLMFDEILFGTDEERALRLLESIPGIRGECLDPSHERDDA